MGVTTIGFKDVANSGDEYDYDDNGNLISDLNKGSSITYNDLNKTSRVYYAADKYMDYVYDASGARIRKVVKSEIVTTTYDYLHGFVYENSSLSYFPTIEGRVRASGSKFEYFIKDHVGNVRVSFEDNGSGVAKIVQENHYYAFGMTMKGIVNRTAVPTTPNKQLFNAGSELQDDLGDETYSTFFREYDPVLGRFNALDPMVDKYASWTPYNFAFNDPIGVNDPMGDEGTSHQDTQDLPTYTEDQYRDEYNKANKDGYITPGEQMWLNYILESSLPSNPILRRSYLDQRGTKGYMHSIDLSYGVERKTTVTQSVSHRTVTFDLNGRTITAIEISLVEKVTTVTTKILGNFWDGFQNAPESKHFELSALIGIGGMVLDVGAAVNSASAYLPRTRFSSFSDLRSIARTAKALKWVGIGVGAASTLVKGYEAFSDGKITLGEGVSFGISAISIIFPAVGVIDFGVEMFTGTSLSDRIEEGIDSALPQANLNFNEK
ncbi:MAG: repeat-associated core domain protein [Daejeonella sp.]|nr:repeat-associated core domain protein [Daejeonella sp.]